MGIDIAQSERDIGACLRQRERDGPAKTAARSGHKSDLARQVELRKTILPGYHHRWLATTTEDPGAPEITRTRSTNCRFFFSQPAGRAFSASFRRVVSVTRSEAASEPYCVIPAKLTSISP